MHRPKPKPKNQTISFEVVIQYAYYLLARRAYSRAKLMDKFCARFGKNVCIDRSAESQLFVKICTAVLDRLEDLKLIDDRNYAEQLKRNGLGYKMSGKNKIRNQMKLKKIPANIINDVLDNVAEEEKESAYKLLEAKWYKLNNEENVFNKKIKIANLLKNRGFSGSVISDVLHNYNDIVRMMSE